MQFDFEELRRRRWLISAQRLERSDNLGTPIRNKSKTLKAFANSRTLAGFNRPLTCNPKVVASSNLGLKLANAFGVCCSEFKLHHYALFEYR